jgi:hypothetical protein
MIESDCKIQLPVAFNCWKHHAGFIKDQIKSLRYEKLSEENLRKILLVIGESQMDIYLGKLSPQEISDNIIIKLKTMNAYEFNNYKNWLCKEGKDYKLIKISDNSVWTLRSGNKKERYIHIHPGRYLPKTIRVKALTLKTAISVLIKYGSDVQLIDTSRVNKVRVKTLNSPPVKKVSADSAVVRVINILR